MNGLAAKLYVFPVECDMSIPQIASIRMEQTTRKKSPWLTDAVALLFTRLWKIQRHFWAYFEQRSYRAVHKENLEDLTKSEKEILANPQSAIYLIRLVTLLFNL